MDKTAKQAKTNNLYDLMTPEQREEAREFVESRKEKAIDDGITLEQYMTAEFGMYYGWGAIEAAKRQEITLDEMVVHILAARKVWYNQVLDASWGQLVAFNAAQAADPTAAYEKGMTSFRQKAGVSE